MDLIFAVIIRFVQGHKAFRLPAFGALCLLLAALLLTGCQDKSISVGSELASDLPTGVFTPTNLPATADSPAETGTAPPADTKTPPAATSVSAIPSGGASEDISSTPAINSGESPLLEETSVVQFPLTVNEAPVSDPAPQPTEVSPTPEPEVTRTSDYPYYDGPPLGRSDIGVQVHIHREDQVAIFDHLVALDVGWVKLQVSWKIYESQPGQWDDFRLDELDRFIAQAKQKNIQVLLSVAKAPEWSRPTAEMDGPPSDPAHFQAFMQRLASRYQGQVAAYELWNEPNLQREWNGFPLSAADFVTLIQAGANGARAADPQAILISGAPAPTGINDGISAIDDRQYLRSMAAAGIGGVVDAVGIHPYGWANPADSSWLDPEQFTPTHNNHPSFFYADTLNDYRKILNQNGMGSMPLWSTEFGWGSYEGLNETPPPGVEYMDDVNEWQQAAYSLKAYQLAQEWDVKGPLILWNLNFAPTFGSQFVESAYSLLRPDGSKRPVYYSITTITKSD